MLRTIVICNTFVIAITGDDNASGGRGALQMLTSIDAIFTTQTVIIPLAGNGNTDILTVADKVFAGVAFIALLAIVGSLTVHHDAEVVHTLKMLVIFETVCIGCAGIITGSIHGDAGVALADVVLGTVVVGNTFVIGISLDNDARSIGAFEMLIGIETIFAAQALIPSFARKRNTDILRVTDKVFSGVAFVTLLACVRDISIDDGAEVSDAFKMFLGLKTIPILRTFIIPCSIHSDAGVALTDIVLQTVIVGDAFVIGIAGDDNAGCGGGTFEVLTGVETVGSIFAFIGRLSYDTNTGIIFTFKVLAG